MTKQELDIIKGRLQSCIDSVRFQSSGCDIHTVGNIRNTAQMLLQQLDEDPDCMEDKLILQITQNVEKSVGDFFTKKYKYLWQHPGESSHKSRD